jgi:hypothetical protein
MGFHEEKKGAGVLLCVVFIWVRMLRSIDKAKRQSTHSRQGLASDDPGGFHDQSATWVTQLSRSPFRHVVFQVCSAASDGELPIQASKMGLQHCSTSRRQLGHGTKCAYLSQVMARFLGSGCDVIYLARTGRKTEAIRGAFTVCILSTFGRRGCVWRSCLQSRTGELCLEMD